MAYCGVNSTELLTIPSCHSHMVAQANGGIQQTVSGGQHRGAWSEHLILKRASSLMQSKVSCLLQGCMILTSIKCLSERIITFVSPLLILQLAKERLYCSQSVLHPAILRSSPCTTHMIAQADAFGWKLQKNWSLRK